MLFPKSNGKFIELKRCDYVNDVEYYTAIIRTKGGSSTPSVCNPDARILKAFKNKIGNTNAASSSRK